MNTYILNLLSKHVVFPNRLQSIVSWYLLSIMLDLQKHTMTAVAELSGKNKSSFSHLLCNHKELAITGLQILSEQIARSISEKRKPIVEGAPWRVAIIIDATLHVRSSLKVQNSQRFNHGEGWVIGHQWTNIVIMINGKLIPLPPIIFRTKKESKRLKIPYRTEHSKLIEYLDNLSLSTLIGLHDPTEIVVVMDAGYDNKKIQSKILDRGWDFIGAAKKSRGCQTQNIHFLQPKNFQSIDSLFREVRKQAPWQTVHLTVDGKKKKRKDFRVRQLIGFIKGISSPTVLVCSEKAKGKGRKHFICSNITVNIDVILSVYQKRWAIELFHRDTKSYLGLQDAGVQKFDSLISHVHWVYCAYLLLQEIKAPPDIGISGRQKIIRNLCHEFELKKIINLTNRFGGIHYIKKHCFEAIEALKVA